MPKSTQLCSTYMSTSSNEPGSSSTASRSRAVSRPLACCAAIRFSPPPSLAASRLFSNSSTVVTTILTFRLKRLMSCVRALVNLLLPLVPRQLLQRQGTSWLHSLALCCTATGAGFVLTSINARNRKARLSVHLTEFQQRRG